jgi:CRP-like cAMP-binding protein
MNTNIRSAPPFDFICPLHSRDVFGGLPQKVTRALPAITSRKAYRGGETIFEEGEMPPGILKMEMGTALLSYTPPGKKARQTRRLEPDEIWGLTEVLADAPMEVSLLSDEPTIFELIPADEFIRLVRKENSLCFRLLQLLSSRYQAKWARMKARING